MGKKTKFSSPWFSLIVMVIAIIMFIRYLVPALNTDNFYSHSVELIIWLAMAITFFIRSLLQLKSREINDR